MPDSYGNAKDFFISSLNDGEKNVKRDLLQYTNPSKSKPQIGDLLIYSSTILNKYGHVAIVSNVENNKLEIIQQNPGPFSPSRETFNLFQVDNKWKIDNSRILGWLRKEYK
jgi:surface antigen